MVYHSPDALLAPPPPPPPSQQHPQRKNLRRNLMKGTTTILTIPDDNGDTDTDTGSMNRNTPPTPPPPPPPPSRTMNPELVSSLRPRRGPRNPQFYSHCRDATNSMNSSMSFTSSASMATTTTQDEEDCDDARATAAAAAPSIVEGNGNGEGEGEYSSHQHQHQICYNSCSKGGTTLSALGDIVTETFELINELAFHGIIDTATQEARRQQSLSRTKNNTERGRGGDDCYYEHERSSSPTMSLAMVLSSDGESYATHSRDLEDNDVDSNDDDNDDEDEDDDQGESYISYHSVFNRTNNALQKTYSEDKSIESFLGFIGVLPPNRDQKIVTMTRKPPSALLQPMGSTPQVQAVQSPLQQSQSHKQSQPITTMQRESRDDDDDDDDYNDDEQELLPIQMMTTTTTKTTKKKMKKAAKKKRSHWRNQSPLSTQQQQQQQQQPSSDGDRYACVHVESDNESVNDSWDDTTNTNTTTGSTNTDQEWNRYMEDVTQSSSSSSSSRGRLLKQKKQQPSSSRNTNISYRLKRAKESFQLTWSSPPPPPPPPSIPSTSITCNSVCASEATIQSELPTIVESVFDDDDEEEETNNEDGQYDLIVVNGKERK